MAADCQRESVSLSPLARTICHQMVHPVVPSAAIRWCTQSWLHPAPSTGRGAAEPEDTGDDALRYRQLHPLCRYARRTRRLTSHSRLDEIDLQACSWLAPGIVAVYTGDTIMTAGTYGAVHTCD